MTDRGVLIVSTYSPRRCGVAAYAKQAVGVLRQRGVHVDVLSPPDCEGTFREPLRGHLNPLRVLRHTSGHERVVVQYSHPEFYHGERPAKWLNPLTTLAFLILFVILRDRLEVVIHEPPRFPNRWHRITLARLTWRLAPQVIFHSPTERRLLEEHLGLRFRDRRSQIVEHLRDFGPFVDVSREEARRSLGLDLDRRLFLGIGFLQPSKGFDRIARVFARERPTSADLYIVGSIRLEHDLEARAHLDELGQIAAEWPSIHIVESYISDEAFDTWILAADLVVLPYRSISSSGVLARARLLERPALVADVGGLRDQLGPADRVFATDEELTRLVLEFTESIHTAQ